MALLVQGELFAQKEIFCHQGSRWAQTRQQEAHSITQKHQQDTHQLHEVMEQARYTHHTQSTLLRQKNHA